MATMLPKSPLLPVHSMRHAQKRSRRKGSCMRYIIYSVILFGIGYAIFASRHIGTSKERSEAHDSYVRTQLERESDGSMYGSDNHQSRGLKTDAYSPHLDVRDHMAQRHVRGYDRQRHHTLPKDDPFHVIDGGSYDDVITHDDSQRSGSVHGGKQSQVARPQLHPQVQPHLHPQVQQPQLHNVHQPQPQLHSVHQQPKPVSAGPIESDRESDLKLTAHITSPSLAVGSRIEVDNHANAPVLEPGASPVQHSLQEPTSQKPVHHEAPLTITNVEPGSTSIQVPVHKEPVPSPAPFETASSTPTTQHKAPEVNTQQVNTQQPTVEPTATISTPTVAAPTTTSSGGGAVPGIQAGGVGGVSPTVVVAPSPVAPVTVPDPQPAPVVVPQVNTAQTVPQGLFALEATDIDGKVRKLSEFAGKIVIVVNVASACGYTDENYKGLQKVYDKYRAHGLEVLGFPCNQFGSQESGSEAEIKNFCSSRYQVTFPMFSKVDVNGPNTHPIYKFLKNQLPESEGGGAGTYTGHDMVWNFQKIFVNHEGRPVKRLYQGWDQAAVEQLVYTMLQEARVAKANTKIQ